MGTAATFQLTQHLRTGRRSCLCARYEGGRWWVQVSCISQKTWLMQTRTHTFHLVNMRRSRLACVREPFSHHFISNPMHVVGPGRSMWLGVHLCVQITLEIKIHNTSGRQRVTTLLDAISSTYTISKESTQGSQTKSTRLYSIHTYGDTQISGFSVVPVWMPAVLNPPHSSHKPLCLRDIGVNDAAWLSVLLWLSDCWRLSNKSVLRRRLISGCHALIDWLIWSRWQKRRARHDLRSRFKISLSADDLVGRIK